MGVRPMSISDNPVFKKSFADVTLRPRRRNVLSSVVTDRAGLEIKLAAAGQTNVTAIRLSYLRINFGCKRKSWGLSASAEGSHIRISILTSNTGSTEISWACGHCPLSLWSRGHGSDARPVSSWAWRPSHKCDMGRTGQRPLCDILCNVVWLSPETWKFCHSWASDKPPLLPP